jgi:nitroreductase
MELKEVIGNRRSMRFLRPYKRVEREKIQKMLEAARRASHWGNVQATKAVVIERATAPKEVVDALPVGTAIAGFQFRTAPVVIVWYIDWSALPKQGDRLHELVEAGALGVNKEKSHLYLDQTLIPFFDGAMEMIKVGGVNEVEATLVAFEEGLGTCCLGLPFDKKLRKAIKLPDDTKIVLLQTVGYPAEDPKAGGQRPRRDFEYFFSLNTADNPFPYDKGVEEELKKEGMLQEPGPLPEREQELRWLADKYGLSDDFGDEDVVPNIMKEMMEDMQEQQDK